MATFVGAGELSPLGHEGAEERLHGYRVAERQLLEVANRHGNGIR
jgi:hypothetical protein